MGFLTISIFSYLLGALTIYILVLYIKHRSNQKKGRRLENYNKSTVLQKLKDTLRHIVFEYNVKRKNNDFTLNVYLNGSIALQVLHRSHFPDLARSEDDINFGLALYVPVKHLNKIQKELMIKVLKEESEVFYFEEVPFDYFIIDIGKRIQFGGYLITRIIHEVFKKDSENMTFELFSEGALSYIGLDNNHPKKSN